MNYPGVNSNLIVNHESTTYIDANGEKITKDHLSVPTKTERENILFWQFMQYHNEYEDVQFPMFWKERDAPHDFTVENHSGDQLKIEVVSMGNQTVGDEFDNHARALQGKRAFIQRRLEGMERGRGHLIVFYARIPQAALHAISEDRIRTIDHLPEESEIRAWLQETRDAQRVVVVELQGQNGPNIYQYDSGIVGNKMPYAELVKHAIREKESMPYENHGAMTLLIDDRTTWYSKSEVMEFFNSKAVRQISNKTKFLRICILVSAGGGHLGEHGYCEYFSIKSPRYFL